MSLAERGAASREHGGGWGKLTLRLTWGAASATAILLALLPVLSVACSNGNSCLRLSDCADGMMCQAGKCGAPSAAASDADVPEGSVASGGDANAQSQDSASVDGGASETDAKESVDAEQTDADTGNEVDSGATEADAG